MTSLSDMADQIGYPGPLTPQQRRHAALTVCEAAHDADDARLLLGALGLEEA